MFLDDSAGNRQAQTSATLFGGKKRLEQSVKVLGWDANSIVLNRNAQLPQIAGISEAGARGLGKYQLSRDREAAVWPRCVSRIHEQIHKSLLQLHSVPIDQVG